MSRDAGQEAAELTLDFEAGAWVFREGDLGAEMFIIAEGQVSILAEEDPEEPPLAVLGPGDFFGEMAVLEGEVRSASARAITPCELLVIDGSTFEQMIRTDPEIAIRMMRKLAHRLRTMLAEEERQDRPSLAMEIPVPLAAQEAESEESSEIAAGPRLELPDRSVTFAVHPEGETTVGRRDAATGLVPDIDLEDLNEDQSISRRHARILAQDGGFSLTEDLGAANGTYLNDHRLQRGVAEPITTGDRIRFSSVELVFHAT